MVAPAPAGRSRCRERPHGGTKPARTVGRRSKARVRSRDETPAGGRGARVAGLKPEARVASHLRIGRRDTFRGHGEGGGAQPLTGRKRVGQGQAERLQHLCRGEWPGS
eukprot:scaffold29747_cov107-Isochrysis_galbana.AAC.3